MRRLLPLFVLVLIPVPPAALADGCPPSSCGTTSSAIGGSDTLFVRPSGQQGPLQAFNVFSGQRRFVLPRGLLSADGLRFVTGAQAKAKRTTVARFDSLTGRLQRGWSVRGRWFVAGVSADGARVVLAHQDRSRIVFRTARSRRVLRGAYEVEALSGDGRRLFLVHWRANGYDLQQLDLASGRLSPTRLDDPDEKMSGTAITAVATRDGHWLLTLYAKADGGSFVHALDLQTGLAHCIDLSLRGDYLALDSTALTLSPDERSLYLASPYLGRVTTVDLDRLEQAAVVRFRGLSPSNIDMSTGPSGAVTPNGRMLVFSGGGSLWLFDTAYGVLRRAASGAAAIRGVGFRPGGRSGLAIRAHASPLVFDAATGARR